MIQPMKGRLPRLAKTHKDIDEHMAIRSSPGIRYSYSRALVSLVEPGLMEFLL